jgi:hypothetical protein
MVVGGHHHNLAALTMGTTLYPFPCATGIRVADRPACNESPTPHPGFLICIARTEINFVPSLYTWQTQSPHFIVIYAGARSF